MKIISSSEVQREVKTLCAKENVLLDIWHKNEWDGCELHDRDSSYIDFFFNAKEMVEFLVCVLNALAFDTCIFAPCSCRYRLKTPNDDVSSDIYDEYKRFLHSAGLRVNTNRGILLTKTELLGWADRFSLGGFSDVAEYSVIIPECGTMIVPHHHMNYLITTDLPTVIREVYDRRASEKLMFSLNDAPSNSSRTDIF